MQSNEATPKAQTNEVMQRLAWGLAEIAESTGLSLGFIRNEVRRKALPVKRFGRRLLVLEEDLKNYLANGSQSTEETQGNAPTEQRAIAR